MALHRVVMRLSGSAPRAGFESACHGFVNRCSSVELPGLGAWDTSRTCTGLLLRQVPLPLGYPGWQGLSTPTRSGDTRASECQWSLPDSNRPPSACKTDALPDELRPRGADDRARTGDLHLGKVTRYQLRYIRVSSMETRRGRLHGVDDRLALTFGEPVQETARSVARMGGSRCQTLPLCPGHEASMIMRRPGRRRAARRPSRKPPCGLASWAYCAVTSGSSGFRPPIAVVCD